MLHYGISEIEGYSYCVTCGKTKPDHEMEFGNECKTCAQYAPCETCQNIISRENLINGECPECASGILA